MRKVLVTGINGFVGQHLVRELKTRHAEVIGIGREASILPGLEGFVSRYYACDLTDAVAVNRLQLNDVDAVISLAGLARFGDSFSRPELYKEVNVKVLTVLCEALVAKQLQPRVLAISSGAVYDSHQPMPLSETSEVAIKGAPYVQSKLAMEEAAMTFRQKKQLPECFIVRPFNHIGPGQELGFLVPDLYQQIVEAVLNKQPLKTGDLSTRRDYTDVRDVVKAYADLAFANNRQLTYPVYNVCSGVAHNGTEVLRLLLKHIANAEHLQVEIDPDRIRSQEPRDSIGDNSRLHKATGWQPSIQLEQTIADFVASKQS